MTLTAVVDDPQEEGDTIDLADQDAFEGISEIKSPLTSLVVVRAVEGCHEYMESFGTDLAAARRRAYNLTESKHFEGEYVVDVEPGHQERQLPVTGRGRVEKAKREGWDWLGDYKLRRTERGLAEFANWDVDGHTPKLRLRYVPECLHWRCEVTRGEFDEHQSELNRGSFEQVLKTAREYTGDEN